MSVAMVTVSIGFLAWFAYWIFIYESVAWQKTILQCIETTHPQNLLGLTLSITTLTAISLSVIAKKINGQVKSIEKPKWKLVDEVMLILWKIIASLEAKRRRNNTSL